MRFAPNFVPDPDLGFSSNPLLARVLAVILPIAVFVAAPFVFVPIYIERRESLATLCFERLHLSEGGRVDAGFSWFPTVGAICSTEGEGTIVTAYPPLWITVVFYSWVVVLLLWVAVLYYRSSMEPFSGHRKKRNSWW
ncbi:hypothetical protein [Compostimonas suwonensis]|uniref:hypothetical protein n=1 Tax=Compostimonas suwonensis TaxID=1048394 RepID=UPI0012FD479E|nr:hypothetical protein [Compostimonas suwonensis]